MKTIHTLACLAFGLFLCTTVSAQTGEVKTRTVYEVDAKGKKIQKKENMLLLFQKKKKILLK